MDKLEKGDTLGREDGSIEAVSLDGKRGIFYTPAGSYWVGNHMPRNYAPQTIALVWECDKGHWHDKELLEGRLNKNSVLKALQLLLDSESYAACTY